LKKVWKLSEKVLIFASAFAKKAGAAEAKQVLWNIDKQYK